MPLFVLGQCIVGCGFVQTSMRGECVREVLRPDTSLFIKGRLPGTGGPFPMLVLLGIAAVTLGAVAGIVVLRRS